MKIRRYFFALILVAMLAACGTIQNVANTAPAAQTPSGITVSAILVKGGSWTTVGRNGSGEYEILPGGLPSGGTRLYFYVPYPSTLAVDIDGMALPKFEDIPQGTNPATTGYFRIININPNPNPAIWTVGVRPPNSKVSSTRYVINVKNVSINPNFQGTDKVSNPLSITAVAQKSNVLGVAFPGTGHGTLQIDALGGAAPVNTSCSADCSIDFGQSVNVTLRASPSGNATFSGWTGACTGTGATCSFVTNGTAMMVSANFTRSTPPPPLQNCPSPTTVPGYSFFDLPLCDSQNIFNDPVPDLGCDAAGYFCCAMANGRNDPGCGVDHAKFPASCHLYNNPKVKLEPSGCYLQD